MQKVQLQLDTENNCQKLFLHLKKMVLITTNELLKLLISLMAIFV